MAEQDSGNLVATPAGAAKDYGDELHPDRKRRADRYFDIHLGKQRDWYGRKAGKSKRWTAVLAFVVLASGAAISVIQLLQGWTWLPYVTAVLGAIVVLAKGLERIGRYEETWLGYRKASEAMKREYRLYINNAGDYAGAAREDEVYRWLVEAVEKIIAEEQNQFWQSRGKEREKEAPGSGDEGGGETAGHP